MVEFTLSKNSKVTKKNIPPLKGDDFYRVEIYRWNPESGENPHIDTFDIPRDECGSMVLDVLIKIKNEVYISLTFRRSFSE